MDKKQALEEVCKYLRYKKNIKTNKDLAATLRITPANLSSALHGNETYLNDKFLLRIADIFPEINVTYLLKGEGPMLKDGAESASAAGQQNGGTRSIDADVFELMKSQQRTIDSQQEMLREQQRSIAKLVDKVTGEGEVKKGTAEAS